MWIENKEATNSKALKLAAGQIKPCEKMGLSNVVLPPWSEVVPIDISVIPMNLNTKEQDNCHYDAKGYRIVIRVLDGKLFGTDGKYDVYAWGPDMIKKYLSDPSKVPPIGRFSSKGMVNFSRVVNTIVDEDEKEKFANIFVRANCDYYLVNSDKEDRRCIEVTAELYEAGLTHIVDTWMKAGENGLYSATELRVGDFIIVEPKGGIYCIRRDEFLSTHKLV